MTCSASTPHRRMTLGRWLYAAAFLSCVFLQDLLVGSEPIALARDLLFICSLTLIWREMEAPRLVEIGWLALVAGLLAGGVNGTPLTALLTAVGAGSLLGGYRLRFGAPAGA